MFIDCAVLNSLSAQCIGPNECACDNQCVNGACRNGQCVCHAGYTGESCSVLDRNTMPNKDVAIGMNVGGITYYSSEVKFVDIFKQSMEWITQRDGVSSWNTDELDKITFRDDGYPASLEDGLKLVTLVYRGFGSHEENGDYTILYDGEGELGFGLTQYSYKYSGKGRLVVNFPHLGSGGIELLLKKTNPSNPLHNIRILAPGYEYTYERFPFHPLFLESIRLYSEYRYMDFMHTNGHKPEPTTWATRRKPDFQTQAGEKGGAIEYMVELSNTMGANPWFCMPHAADDDYVTKFAQYVKANLRSDLKIYVEYSNEVWNSIFRQTKYTGEQGAPLFPSDPSWKQGMRYYNYRSAQIADLWMQEFAGSTDRIIPVWAWQTGYRDYTRQALADLGTNVSKFKALAITGYFDCGSIAGKNADQIVGMTMTEIQQFCDAHLDEEKDTFTHYMGVAKANGLKLLMYEGGPGISENSAIVNGQSQQAVADQAIAFNRDSAIEGPLTDVLDAWNSIVTQNPDNDFPGGLFNYFSSTGTPSKYGSWGMLEYTGQKMEDVPKYRAVATYITTHYPQNMFGPLCSYVEGSQQAFGCYSPGLGSSRFECGRSDDGFATSTPLSGLRANDTDFVVLDGANFASNTLYIRVVDGTLATSTYYSYRLNNSVWTEMVNFYYYSELFAAPTVPRLPEGYVGSLQAPYTCSVSQTTVVG